MYSGKLTKKELMNFEEGNFLVSNCHSDFDRKPLIDIQLGSFESREELWINIKRVGANGRLCKVFKQYDDYIIYMEEHKIA